MPGACYNAADNPVPHASLPSSIDLIDVRYAPGYRLTALFTAMEEGATFLLNWAEVNAEWDLWRRVKGDGLLLDLLADLPVARLQLKLGRQG